MKTRASGSKMIEPSIIPSHLITTVALLLLSTLNVALGNAPSPFLEIDFSTNTPGDENESSLPPFELFGTSQTEPVRARALATIPTPTKHVDFGVYTGDLSTSIDGLPFTLEGNAEISPIGDDFHPPFFHALRIQENSNGQAKIQNIDISPNAMPYATLMISVRLVGISNNRGWVLNHDNGVYDRAIVMYDSVLQSSRFITTSVGTTNLWNPWNVPEQPSTDEWIHIAAVFRKFGEECSVYVNGEKADKTTTCNNPDNSAGHPYLRVGNYLDHPSSGVDWSVNSWIKDVMVFNETLDDEDISHYYTQFSDSVDFDGYVYYRITNADYTGWCPHVEEWWMEDSNGERIEDATIICSGTHANIDGNTCIEGANFRPQCSQCQAREAWIGYKVPSNVVVKRAYAKNLGLSLVAHGGQTWNGGVALQRSDDNGISWSTIVESSNSNEVIVPSAPTNAPTNAPSSLPSLSPTGSIYDIGPQSQFKWTTSSIHTPTFDWNITITDFMSIDKATTEQGIYNLRSKYILDDRSFDVELFKVDCVNAPSGIDKLPLVFKKGTVDSRDDTSSNVKEIDVELEWTYNQTKIESSDLWTANKTGGYSEFCIKVNNYLKDNDHDFGREIHFLEVKYKIEVDSLTDFNETITVDRIDATDGGVEEINYEEEITVFQCTDDYTEITSPVPLTQGDFLQLCVTTKGESKFGVHSVKELDVSQQDNTPSLYPYVDGFVDSPLAESMCKAEVKNTSAAVCKTKMQLLSAYFDLTEPATDPAALFANGTVKLDYVGRRLSVDVPLNLRYGDSNGALKGAAVDVAAASRVLAEEDGGPSFGLEVGLSGGDGGQSDASTSALSMGGLFSAGMAFLAGAGML